RLAALLRVADELWDRTNRGGPIGEIAPDEPEHLAAQVCGQDARREESGVHVTLHTERHRSALARRDELTLRRVAASRRGRRALVRGASFRLCLVLCVGRHECLGAIAGAERLELPTRGFGIRCSTN